MITLTLDELELNAVRAALGDRLAKMALQLADLRELRDSPDNERAIEWTEDAIREATRAQLSIDQALDEAVAAVGGIVRWIRVDDSFVHLFPADRWMRSLCGRISWTATLRHPEDGIPTCHDCLAAAVATVAA